MTEIDKKSGFCFGVVNAINRAEEELAKNETLYCLGDIVHNNQELERLKAKGLITINHEEFEKLHDAKVILRAHGEPPSTYETARKNNITIIDASCPVVLNLQKRIKKAYEKHTQIVIFGKNGHAEVVGLVGQTGNKAIVIENKNDLDKIDFTQNITLFSQTTKSLSEFNEIVELIKQRISPDAVFEYNDTICRQVANRIPNLREFARKHDLVFFVSGRQSSNGKALFEECKKVNKNTFLISTKEEIDKKLITENIKSIGICGATSTPKWLMEEVERYLLRDIY
ncbi:4-hydroxy-3-methylbut-2-enyl diphosphate reductase [Bacteroidia bacterium]|nr:4-hydroxy-3-methylbut-2-enyl diphosphate reductase [Bacteroidia bacterium]